MYTRVYNNVDSNLLHIILNKGLRKPKQLPSGSMVKRIFLEMLKFGLFEEINRRRMEINRCLEVIPPDVFRIASVGQELVQVYLLQLKNVIQQKTTKNSSTF